MLILELSCDEIMSLVSPDIVSVILIGFKAPLHIFDTIIP